jgi:SAM-dependent methyltransferase
MNSYYRGFNCRNLLQFKMPPSQDLSVNAHNKTNYGEIHTPFALIDEMLGTLPAAVWSNPELRWLDPGCGRGYFAEKIAERLGANRPAKMLTLVEVNPEHKALLEQKFGEKATIHIQNFLEHTPTPTPTPTPTYDIIVGNPPFNANGIKKTPTNTVKNKRHDGKTIWKNFIYHALSLLKPGGYLLFFVPSIWMKAEYADRPTLYDAITQHTLLKVRCYTNTQTNQLFKGHAQTPCCYFLLKKEHCKKSTEKKAPALYDACAKAWVDYALNREKIIPVFGVSRLNTVLPYTWKYGCIEVLKTNLPSEKIGLSAAASANYVYPNIKTCVVRKAQGGGGGAPQLQHQPGGKKWELVINYSDQPCPFYGETKLVLAHGMDGVPYFDEHGTYGVSNRDKYVILGHSKRDFERLAAFLATDFAKYLFRCTRYRMMYLEKYIFRLLPDITKIPGFPATITDASVTRFFTQK